MANSSEKLKTIYGDTKLADYVIVLKNEAAVPIHGLVIYSKSQALLENLAVEGEKKIIFPKSYSDVTIHSFVHFCYGFPLTLDDTNVETAKELMMIAKAYEVIGLEDAAASVLMELGKLSK